MLPLRLVRVMSVSVRLGLSRSIGLIVNVAHVSTVGIHAICMQFLCRVVAVVAVTTNWCGLLLRRWRQWNPRR